MLVALLYCGKEESKNKLKFVLIMAIKASKKYSSRTIMLPWLAHAILCRRHFWLSGMAGLGTSLLI